MAIKTKAKPNNLVLGNQSDITGSLSFSGADIKVIAYRNSKSIFNTENKKRINELVSLEKREEQLTDAFRRRFGDENISNEILVLSRKAIGELRDSIDKKRSKLINPLVNYKVLDSVHTFSFSSFREKFAVRSLGRTQPISYTRGPRTIAGSMVMVAEQESELFELTLTSSPDGINKKNTDELSEGASGDVMLDQIDPLNIMLFFANEYGAYSVMHFFDVEISAEGQEMSVDKPVTFNTINFYAKEMLTMKNMGNLFTSEAEMIARAVYGLSKEDSKESRGERASSLLYRNSFGDNEINDMLAKSRGLF